MFIFQFFYIKIVEIIVIPICCNIESSQKHGHIYIQRVRKMNSDWITHVKYAYINALFCNNALISNM